MADIIKLPVGLIVYGNIAKPYAFKEGQEAKYGVTIAWPTEAYDAKDGEWMEAKRAIHAVATEAWGAEQVKRKRDGSPAYVTPFQYGADTKTPDRFDGLVLGRFSSKGAFAVGIAGSDGSSVLLEPGKVERGMAAMIATKPKAYDIGNVRRVVLYPHALLITNPEPDTEFNARTGKSEDEDGNRVPVASDLSVFGRVAVAKAPSPAPAPTPAPAPQEPPDDSDIPF